MSTIPQNEELLKHLFEILEAHRRIFTQTRVYNRAVALLLSELMVFTRHTITQQLIALGLTEADWSAWYRLFSEQRFDYDAGSEILFEQSLLHVAEDELYVTVGDGTQTPRSGRKMEGSGWLRNMRTPAFMIGIHAAQRWFNGAWLMPAENGYSRALPLRWMPAFTEKSEPQEHAPMKEWEAAVEFLTWLREQFAKHGRNKQNILMVADGGYDTINLWKYLPDGVILMARSAKNRVLHYLPPEDAHANRKYGERAPAPQDIWRNRKTKWRKLKLDVRGKTRRLQYHIMGPVLRKGVSERPLFLIVVRGKHNARTRRKPLPFLVNAVQNEQGEWVLPCRSKPSCFGCGNAGKSKFVIGNSRAILAWATNNVTIPMLPFYRFNGALGSIPLCSWLATALGV
ncbi:MAG: transposase [Anaerolineae bacterium]|nr:transposase [Anaerolineae bacterium]